MDSLQWFRAIHHYIHIYPDDATTLDTLLHCADSAMYGAKAAGGARILAYAKEG